MSVNANITKHKKIVMILTACLAGFVVALLSGEFLLRAAYGPYYGPYTISWPDGDYRYVPDLNFVTKNVESGSVVQIRTNSHGLVDREWPPKKRDRKRIVVIGDSFVAGLQVPMERRFTALMQREYDRLGWGVEVLNAGVGGRGMINYLIMIKSLQSEIHPDHFIVLVNNSDDFQGGEVSAVTDGTRVRYRVSGGRVVRSEKPDLRSPVKVSVSSAIRSLWLYRLALKVSSLIKNSVKKNALLILAVFRGDHADPDVLLSEKDDKSCLYSDEVSIRKIQESSLVNAAIAKEMQELTDGKVSFFQIPTRQQVKAFKENRCGASVLEDSFADEMASYDLLSESLLKPMSELNKNLFWSHLNEEGHEFLADFLISNLNFGMKNDNPFHGTKK